MNKRLEDYILGLIGLVALGVFGPFCRPTKIGLHFVGPSYVGRLGHSALKPSSICLLEYLKSWRGSEVEPLIPK